MSIAVIGAGAMGQALIAGWIATGSKPADIWIVEASAERAGELVAQYGVRSVALAEAATAECVLLAVKPQQIDAVLGQLAPQLRPDALVISIAAGVRLAQLSKALPAGQPVVRVMPNTPALVGKGMAGIALGAEVNAAQREQVLALMGAVGKTMVVPETSLDAVTAISGSGPAYLFLVAEAMIEAGVQQGLTRAQATELVNQTILGSAAMLAESGKSATVLREQVTSPGGTTAAALAEFEERGLRATFAAAIQACRLRSQEMCSESTK